MSSAEFSEAEECTEWWEAEGDDLEEDDFCEGLLYYDYLFFCYLEATLLDNDVGEYFLLILDDVFGCLFEGWEFCF